MKKAHKDHVKYLMIASYNRWKIHTMIPCKYYVTISLCKYHNTILLWKYYEYFLTKDFNKNYNVEKKPVRRKK